MPKQHIQDLVENAEQDESDENINLNRSEGHTEELEQEESEATLLPQGISHAESPITGRLDAALRSLYRLSNKGARKLISTGKVSVSEIVCEQWETPVAMGEKITVNPNAPNPSKRVALGASLIYQDSALAVISKPSGLLSAPGHDSDEESALQAASRLCRGPRRPRVVHRLDKETSGLLLFARTIPAARQLQLSIQERSVKRVYRCIVRGEINSKGAFIFSQLVRDAGQGKRGSLSGTLKQRSLNLSIPQEPTPQPMSDQLRPHIKSQWALTRYRVIKQRAGFSALEVELFTGRTHQIRIHLAEIGYPIVGEWVYAPRVKREPRLMLHAARLSLPHPFKEEVLHFEAPWPDELSEHPGVPSDWLSDHQQRPGQTKAKIAKKRSGTKGPRRS